MSPYGHWEWARVAERQVPYPAPHASGYRAVGATASHKGILFDDMVVNANSGNIGPSARPRGRKRANGEGSIYRRESDGLWVAAISWPDGKRERHYAQTRAEAGKRLQVALHRRSTITTLPSGEDTLATYLENWLATVKPTVRPSTWLRYRGLCRVHVIPRIGRVRLGRLQPGHLDQLYAATLAAGLSPTTAHHIHMVVHRALEVGLRQGVVSRNVADLVTPPRVTQGEMHVLKPDEVRALCAQATDDPCDAVTVLAVTTGMRQGELLALRWRDVDLVVRAIAVTATVQRLPGIGFVQGEPKTARSRRQVRLTPTGISILERRWELQTRDRELAVNLFEAGDWVFTNPFGRPISASVLRRRFGRLLTQAALPRVRFHDLRHTTATLLLAQGVHPKVVAELLGHSSVAVTLDRYSHVAMAMHQEATDALEAVLQDPQLAGLDQSLDQ